MLKLIALLLVVVAVCAQPPTLLTGSFSVSDIDTTLPIGTWSDYIYVTASEQPQQSVSIQVIVGNSSGVAQPSTLVFDQLHNVLSFRVKFSELGDAFDNFNVTFSNATDASAGQFNVIPDIEFTSVLRTIKVRKVAGVSDAFPFIGEHSYPIELELSVPSTSSIQVTLQSDSAFVFSPNPVTIPANTRSAWFTYTASSYVSNYLNFSVTGGAEAAFYANSLGASTLELGTKAREFDFASSVLPNVFVGAHTVSSSNGVYIYTREISNSTFTVTPQAADTVFSPASQTLGPNNMQAFFSFVTSTDSTDTIGSVNNAKTVFFYASGGPFDFYEPDAQAIIATTTISAPKRKITTHIAESVFVTNTTYMTISIPAPVANSLTVTLSAGNVWFNTSSVTFTANTTSIVVAVKGIYLGDDVITLALSGNDAPFYEDQDGVTVPISVIHANFISPDQWYVPSLFVGQESPRIPIRASISPVNSVVLTPYASNLIFNPRSLTFRNGTEQQYFTITPLYTNSYSGSVPTSYSSTINWFINGTDQAIFDLPPPLTVYVSPRYIQVKWSAHLRTDNTDYPVDGNPDSSLTETTRYLHKTYKVWASINYIGGKEQVSVTPISPYYSFKPSTLFFDAKHTRIEYEATVTGVAPGSAPISYLIGGQDGGLYSPINDDSFGTAVRPLKIAAAVISPDERIKKGVFLTSHPDIKNALGATIVPAWNFNSGILSGDKVHVESFMLRSFVLPDKSLKITPRSPHVSFSPSSITIKPHHATKRIDNLDYKLTTSDGLDQTYHFNLTGVYLEANFTAHAQAAGLHQVWFELSGDDADYYFRPDDVWMNFRLVMRPDTEPFRVSSSSYLLPSFVVVAAMAVFSLAL